MHANLKSPLAIPAAADPLLAEKRSKGKKRWRTDIITKHLSLYEELQASSLSGCLLNTAVYIAVDDAIVHKLDCLCLGNLDGGSSTADYCNRLLQAAGVANANGPKAVRLSIDEAFFMHYALNCLTVYNVAIDGKTAVKLGTDELWCTLRAARPDFLLLYIAYHHFRSKGWIPRTGLQYGVDFVLYQRHPALAHSIYSVLIMVDGSDCGGGGSTPETAIGELTRPVLSWHDVQVTNRLTAQVGKRLLLFYVQYSGNSKDKNVLNSVKCLREFSVQERCVRRWIPASHRVKLDPGHK